jgi:hypothetical protein
MVNPSPCSVSKRGRDALCTDDGKILQYVYVILAITGVIMTLFGLGLTVGGINKEINWIWIMIGSVFIVLGFVMIVKNSNCKTCERGGGVDMSIKKPVPKSEKPAPSSESKPTEFKERGRDI